MFSKGSTRGIAPGEISGTCCFWNRECEGPRLTSDNVARLVSANSLCTGTAVYCCILYPPLHPCCSH